MPLSAEPIERPRATYPRELALAALEITRLMRQIRELSARAPRGRNAPVVVLPGFLTGDHSTWALRRFLRSIDYRPQGWGLGLNRGDVNRLLPKVVDSVERRAQAERRPVRLVGWSLGGVIARETARRIPSAVHSVVTMGTPVLGGPKYTLAASYYERRGIDLDALEAEVARANAEPVPVPVTAIYSRRDGVVAWQACKDVHDSTEHVEVSAGHLAMGFSVEVYEVLAGCLAAPDS